MSVVVGLKYKDNVWLACDKQITAGDRKTMLDTHHKIFPVPERKGILIGSVGALRGLNLLETNNNYIDELAYFKKEIDYTYMVNDFPLLINELFKIHGLVDAEQKTLNLHNEFLVAVEDKLYLVGWDGSVQEFNDFAVIGSGADLAYGALTANVQEKLSDEQIKFILFKAVSAASYNTGCGGGCIILNTKENKFYEFREK